MNEDRIRRLIDAVRRGRVSRRAFIARLAAAGLPMPMAATLLMDAGVGHKLVPTLSGWANATASISRWYREK